MNTPIPVYAFPLPEYTIEVQPDYAAIGPKLDQFIGNHFAGRRMALRGIYLGDHPDLSRDDLVAIILRLGTDRYDPNRKSMHHDWYAQFSVEVHAVACEVTDRLRGLDDEDYIAAPSFFGEFLKDFYESAFAERSYSLRLDILIVYDLDQLVAVPAEAPRGYAFKNQSRKRDALVGVVSILSQHDRGIS